ncbi:hypothetical protein [Propionibacterium australiense]|uniref:Uncharacterized protein n=1 Tax=Propionibacterium australiense TaxID=119981 RepID=A0A383S799_9ACTN|nr:hypothetical protein [Propionibacterium australiense]RLP08264.1 hypothetical protein D9T14_08810 [Propionibacterium australiense]SYZ33126.1 Hypothetical protein PROPAUS_1041 [Propionibacterium australiense]VEH89142.1 Uncharacterised protein [Propionibacterium australiense]
MSNSTGQGFHCFHCGLHLAPGTAQCPRCGAPQNLARPARDGYPQQPAAEEPLHPAATAIITVFFGLFGLIPCLISTSRAKRLNRSTMPYWLAFWIPEILWLLLVAVMVIGMFAGFGVLAREANSNPGGGPNPATSVSSYPTTAPSATSSEALAWPVGATECSPPVAAGNEQTSCQFALNVASAWERSPKGQTETIQAHSPVTGQDYTMTCASISGYTTCSGGNDAVVYIRG